MKKLLTSLSFGLMLAPLVYGQMSANGYLDQFAVRVKPEKRADFDMVCKKVAEANRKAKGDTFLAMEQIYGEDHTVLFVSTRENLAAIDQANTAFMSAINEAYGVGGMKKMMMDFNPTELSGRSILRVRRPDLSVNAPKDDNAYNQMVGNARYLRITQIRTKPGHGSHFEELVKEAKMAYEKGDQPWTFMASQVVAGQPGGTYYLTTLQPSLAAFDSAPNLKKLMGDETYMRWEKESAEAIEMTETSFYHVLPELSNPPKEVADVAPDFWRPKVVTMSRPKPKPAEGTKAGQQ